MITCEVRPLQDAMKALAPLCRRGSKVFLAVENDVLAVTAGSTDAITRQYVSCSGDLAGTVVEYKPFREVLAHTRGILTLDATENHLQITTVSAVSTLACENETQPDGPGTSSVVTVLPASELYTALGRTIFCVAKPDRYALSGVYLEVDRDTQVVASDTHRLSRCTIPAGTDHPITRILPGVAVKVLQKLLRGCDGDVSIATTPEGLTLSSTGWSVYCRCMEGTYPRYREVIPGVTRPEITITNRKQFMADLKTVMSAGTATVTLQDTGAITLVSCEATVRTQAAAGGGFDAITLDGRFLLDLLRHVDDANIHLQLNGAEHPLRVDALNWTHIIMPIRKTPVYRASA